MATLHRRSSSAQFRSVSYQPLPDQSSPSEGLPGYTPRGTKFTSPAKKRRRLVFWGSVIFCGLLVLSVFGGLFDSSKLKGVTNLWDGGENDVDLMEVGGDLDNSVASNSTGVDKGDEDVSLGSNVDHEEEETNDVLTPTPPTPEEINSQTSMEDADSKPDDLQSPTTSEEDPQLDVSLGDEDTMTPGGDEVLDDTTTSNEDKPAVEEVSIVPPSDTATVLEGDFKIARVGSAAEGQTVPISYSSHGLPIYPPITSSYPTTLTSSPLYCAPYTLPADFTASGPTTVRSDHPRLMADASRWECVKGLIERGEDGYLGYWNSVVFNNATAMAERPTVTYDVDGCLSCSGVLDVAREVQLRIKHWGYMYQMSGDAKWGERAWQELLVASGNSSTPFGKKNNNWNTAHFLDVGEFTVAFALAYDWFYSYWTPEQLEAIKWSIIKLGLEKGIAAYEGAGFGWWREVEGNWNCVIGGGMIMGALAIWEDDTTGTANKALQYAVENVASHCVKGTYSDGTWSETPHYHYFAQTSLSELASALETATGGVWGLWDQNEAAKLSGMFHMYVSGNAGMFEWGDCGPNKYTATSNSMLFYGRHFNIPSYTLFQRDQQDVTEPLGILWYDASVQGTWWDGMDLDKDFPVTEGAWGSLRGSWTDRDAVFVGIKAGKLTGHQTHGHLDVGTFVLDALGERWAGELCQANYLSKGYFAGEEQDSDRWLYYRTRTEGQNTVLQNGENQNVEGASITKFESVGGTGTESDVLGDAFWWTDMSGVYAAGTSMLRGIRLLNSRRQILLQDEITSPSPVQWRMHTNATVTIDQENQKKATLVLNGKQMLLENLGDGDWGTEQPVRLTNDPTLFEGDENQDLANPGVTVLTINLNSGSSTIRVLFNPQWEGLQAEDYTVPALEKIQDWNLYSGNAANEVPDMEGEIE